MNQEKRLEILKALQADNPTPKTELEYHSNFELLIAVVLSAQATDKSVNEARKNSRTSSSTSDFTEAKRRT